MRTDFVSYGASNKKIDIFYSKKKKKIITHYIKYPCEGRQ